MGNCIETQAQMNEKSYDIFRENGDRMFILVKKLKTFLDPRQQILLDQAQAEFFEYMEADARFTASSYEGGSIEPLVFNMRQTSMIESRIIEINDLISRNSET